jgi:PKD repeat protein
VKKNSNPHKNIILILSFIWILTGCKDMFSEPVNAIFYTSKSLAEVEEVLKFENKSIGAETYQWDFGDGNISTLANPIHSFKKKGIYTVTLTSINKRKKNSYSLNIEILSKMPYSKIEIGTFDYHINSQFILKALNNQNDFFKWVVKGDKESLSSTQKEFQLRITQPGSYVISLETFNDRGKVILNDTITIFSTHSKPGFSYYSNKGLNVISKSNFAKNSNNQGLYKFLTAQIDLNFTKLPIWTHSAFVGLNIWISDVFIDNTSAVFHPSREWLIENNQDPDKANGIEISNFINFKSWTILNQPALLLHEMAHFFHFNKMKNGFNNEMIYKYFGLSMNSKKYDLVEYNLGGKRTAYAMTNEKEYFAELTETWFLRNDFYPFLKSELNTYDPDGATLMRNVWDLGLFDFPAPVSIIIINSGNGSSDFDGNTFCGLIKISENLYSKYKGPNGGCFYINKNKNKVYIERGECNC